MSETKILNSGDKFTHTMTDADVTERENLL